MALIVGQVVGTSMGNSDGHWSTKVQSVSILGKGERVICMSLWTTFNTHKKLVLDSR